MKNSISKPINDAVWVGVRILGLYFLIKGLIPILGYLLVGAAAESSQEVTFTPEGQETLIMVIEKVVPIGFLISGLFCALGAYLLFFGKTLHSLLTRIPATKETEVTEVVEMTEAEENEQTTTREMQRLYREFMTSKGSQLASLPKERHEQFRAWLAH